MPPRKKNQEPPKPALVRRPPAHETLRENEYEGLTDAGKIALATDRILDQWTNAAHALVSIGHELVKAAYDGDGRAAFDDEKNSNELFRRISHRLGGVRGGPSKKTLANARRVYAADQVLVTSHFWSRLDFSHQAALVPLPDTATMEEGAKFAIRGGWTVEQTEKWVAEHKKKKKKKRGLRLAPTRKAMVRFHELRDETTLGRIAEEFTRLTPAEKAKVREEAKVAIAALSKLVARLK